MKIINSFFCLFALFIIVGCSEDYPLKHELYKKVVYLTRAADNSGLKDEGVDYAYEWDTIYVSVSVGGTYPTDKDIVVTFKEDDEAISVYNKREKSSTEIQYRHLSPDVYAYPQENTTIKAGKPTAVYPIYVRPETLHCDSLYIIPVNIASVSAYEMNTKDTVLLVHINLINKYSGKYYMYGTKTKFTEDGTKKDSLSTQYRLPRKAVATNKNTIRLFNESTETDKNLAANAFTITVNEADKSLTFASWNKDKFEIISGTGVYLPEMKIFEIKYEYRLDGTRYRIEGYLYKIPDTTVEQEAIDDWIKEHTSQH